MNWDLLNEFSITRDDDAKNFDSLIPQHPCQAKESLVDTWFTEVQQAQRGGIFLAYVADLVGSEMGGYAAVYIRTGVSRTESSPMMSYLSNIGLRCLVVVDPFLDADFSIGEIGQMSVAYLREDPLRFLSQIDPGPSILFHPFYDSGSFADTDAENAYYAKLSCQMLRVISNSRNLTRGPGHVGSGHPLAAGYHYQLFCQMLPQDKQPEEWIFDVHQPVVDQRDGLLAVALASKKIPQLPVKQ